jgi:DNA mismatch repair protein MLH1
VRLTHIQQAGSSSADVSTPQGSTIQNVIGLLYGQSVAKELVKVDVSEMSSPLEEDGLGTLDQDRDKPMDVDNDASPVAPKPKGDPSGRRWSAQAFVTSPNYQAKRFVFLLFINRSFTCRPSGHRLQNCRSFG